MSAVAAPSMKFSKFVDFLLLRLYQLEREYGAGRFFLLNPMAKELEEEVPPAWTRDAARVLESRRLAHCMFMVGGLVQAELSGEGRLWVENEKGAVKELKAELKPVVANVADPNTLSIEAQREPSFTLMEQIEEQLQRDLELSDPARKDLLSDLEMVRTQLKRREPNLPAIAALLESLGRTPSIATRITELINLINP